MSDLTQGTVRFKDRAELLDFLLEVATLTAETLDLDELLAKLGSFIQVVLPFELFAILLYSERRKGLRIRYSIGHRDELVRSLVIPLGEGLTGAAAASRQPVLSGNVTADARYLRAVDAVRSELAVPMLARGRLVGVIDLQSTQLDAYTAEDSALLLLLASRVAASIDNARLFRRVESQNRTLQALAHLSQEFSSTLDLDTLLGKVANGVKQLINYNAFSVLLLDEERGLLRNRFSLRYDRRIQLDNIPLGKGITGAAAERREIVRVIDTAADPRYIESTPGIRSEIALPLLVPDRVVGVMDLESERVGAFTENHARTLSLLAPMIARAVENARLYEELALRERRITENLAAARQLQSLLLLRRNPRIEGLDIAVVARPAQEISGDIFDFSKPNGENAVIAFGDVSGKSAAAALYGAMVSGLLHTLAPRELQPSSLLRSLNDALLERQVHARYVTLIVLLWQARTRTFTVSNAGMFPPVICRKGKIHKQRLEGIPLGLLEGREYDELAFQAEPGDVILLYSDGVHDQRNAADDEYGRSRLYALMETHWEAAPRTIADAVLADLDAFAGGTERADDQTLVVLKVN